MKKRIFLMTLFIIIISLLVGCSAQADQQTQSPEKISIEDDSGVFLEFTPEETFTKIASLSPATTETIFWLGAEEDLIIREDNSNYPEAALDIDSIGAIWGGIPYELLLDKEVDLVIASEIISIEEVNAMRDLGLNVFYMKNPDSYEALFEDFHQVALITGTNDTYEEKIGTLESRYEEVLETVSQAETTPTVFVELDATDPTKPYTVAGGSFIDLMVTLSGGQNIASDIDNPWPQIDTEYLVDKDPEIILLADYEWGITLESVAAREGYSDITAVQNNAIYPIYSYETSVPGPRMVDGLEHMAEAIHPELFE